MAIAKDTREFQAMSVADADGLLMQLARLSAELKKKAAAAEKRKAEIDIQLAADTAEQQQEYSRLFDRLTEYIQAHPERFVRPRNHQVKGVGSYGIEIAPDRYKTVDESLVIEYSDANGLALYQLVPKIDNAAAKQVFRDGGTVPGAKYTPAGDVPKIKIDPSYIEKILAERG